VPALSQDSPNFFALGDTSFIGTRIARTPIIDLPFWHRLPDNSLGMAYINSPWPVKDIVYTSIVGTIMIAALLEWFLWLAAFLFCLVKAYQKAEHWSVKVIAVVIALLFTAIRYNPLKRCTVEFTNNIHPC